MNVLLGISGGIAAYKTPQLVRDLKAAGHQVKVILTENGARFVAELALTTVSGGPVYRDMFAMERSDIDHIALADWADVLVMAPATANVLAKMAVGLADDLLSTTCLATRAPVLVAPGMNSNMWEHPATVSNVALLKTRGVRFVGPAHGELACGITGPGRMSQPDEIVSAIGRLFDKGPLAGRRVLISAGATREHIDPARFISNPSTGRMGMSLARAARDLGAEVTVVHAHVEESLPSGVEAIHALSAAALAEAIEARAPGVDIVIMAAAVGDFTPAEPLTHKMKKEGRADWTLALRPTTDILKRLGEAKARGEISALLVGFAAETASGEALTELARKKLAAKGCDAIVANDISRADCGFAAPTNAVTVVHRSGNVRELPLASKDELARVLFSELLSKVQ